MKVKILSIDDDVNFLKSIKKVLELENYSVTTISNSQKVLEHIQDEHYDTILLDVKMPGLNGIDLFGMLKKKLPTTPIIMISGQSNIQIAVDMLKKGAFDFIEKPLDPEKLFNVLKNVLYKKELLSLKENSETDFTENHKIISKSNKMKILYDNIKMVAPTEAKILILGESGTGKELVAHAVYENSNRKDKPFIKINCAAIPSELLESELFGHKKGSFTGADKDKQGKFAIANGGTIFLDEIGDMNLNLQAKLLRVLEENEIEVIGENIPRKVDVRIIAATNKDLNILLTEGKFREDLYHRLNVIKLELYPLRKRKEDILPLAYHFIKEFNLAYNKTVNGLTAQAEAILVQQKFTGNVRELKNLIEKMVIFAKVDELDLTDLYSALDKKKSAVTIEALTDDEKLLKNAKVEFERSFIIKQLEENDWLLTKTANVLGIDKSNLFKKMQKLDIKKPG